MTPIKAAADPSREALKPCPICQSRLVSLFERQEGLFIVSCENDDCIFGVETHGHSANEAVLRWNTRAAPAGNDGVRQRFARELLHKGYHPTLGATKDALEAFEAALSLPQPREAEPLDLTKGCPCEECEKDRAREAEPVESLKASVPDDLRFMGWSVAVHNDYRVNGAPHTFWLFTKQDRAIKGEGESDEEALNIVRSQIYASPSPIPEAPVTTTFDEVDCKNTNCLWPECKCPKKPESGFVCPICGKDTPHHHAEAEIALRKEALRQYYAGTDHHPVYRRIFIDGGLFALAFPDDRALKPQDGGKRTALDLQAPELNTLATDAFREAAQKDGGESGR